eukprot:CAMPEP_0167823572 /NCGR_PEP_ID=MMETSP0112_2-20121227/8198_1 /TAXON_ID=91324 /ORGANISM="Lotharella globosa, Strain CCCM811" /LENGTH=73 /DNA_ID=CAMNT_0007725209 /DNA_START=875 /DNA_END=1092 /DNA_ORIENTATION=+
MTHIHSMTKKIPAATAPSGMTPRPAQTNMPIPPLRLYAHKVGSSQYRSICNRDPHRPLESLLSGFMAYDMAAP